MKKMPLIIVIPMVIVMIIVGAVAAYRLLSPASAIPVKATSQEYPNAISKSQGSKPSTFMGGLSQGENAPKSADDTTSVSSSATAEDLSTELKDTYDDGGQSELDSIAEDASGL